MVTPLLLDLFSCAGGAGRGYELAGFHVVAVDIAPQKHNPHEFYQDDALRVLDVLLAGRKWNGYRLRDFKVMRASPPCQDYSEGAHIRRAKRVHPDYPRLIGPVRERFLRFPGLWEIENVEGAREEMHNPLMLCGTSLGLRVWRHRLFESNAWLFAAGPCHHQAGDVSVRRKRNEYIGVRSGHVRVSRTDGRIRWRPAFCPIATAKEAMGIDWMNGDELGEAIPPAYTEWIGKQMMTALRYEEAS